MTDGPGAAFWAAAAPATTRTRMNSFIGHLGLEDSSVRGPLEEGRSNGDDDLPDEIPRLLKAPRVERRVERHDRVDDRLDAVGVDRAVHLQAHLARTHADAVERRLLPHQ